MTTKPRLLRLRKRVMELMRRHAHLDDQLARETGRPQPDEMKLQHLKRSKLWLKDEVRRLNAGIETSGRAQSARS